MVLYTHNVKQIKGAAQKIVTLTVCVTALFTKPPYSLPPYRTVSGGNGGFL